MQRSLCVLAGLLALSLQLFGQIPRTISYQGILCDTTGKAKPDNSYQITFRLYEAVTGGSAVWTEQKSLAVKRGLFSTLLGSQVPFGPLVTFDRPYWLSVQIAAEAELSPRVALSSVGSSLRTLNADTAKVALKSTRSDTAAYALVAGSGGSSLWQQLDTNIYYSNGRVGIGTSSPASKLEVANGSVLFSGTTGGTPASGVASRLMWVPAKSAFRAGYADGGQWDDAKIGWGSAATGEGTTASNNWSTATGLFTTANGRSSTAMGYYTTASDTAATAMGHHTQAIGVASMAMGYGTKATGLNSTAMGYNTTASNGYSTAMGYGTTASGEYSTAMGYYTTASSYHSFALGYASTSSGEYSMALGYYAEASQVMSTAIGYYAKANYGSVAIGNYATASGQISTALGWNTTASGNRSSAMGTYVSTNNHPGSFIIGDNSSGTVTVSSSNDNQFMAAFAGGYRLLTDRTSTVGVYMNGGASGWTSISDRNKKENFRHIDGEELLSKIRTMPITEWNYKNSDPSIKYIGPVAQDFHAAFHLGGPDSLGINTICIDGVNMAAIQALEKRTAELQAKTAELEAVKSEFADLKARVMCLEQALSSPKGITQRVSDATGSQR
jgi:trimeric autotransporter adhesin